MAGRAVASVAIAAFVGTAAYRIYSISFTQSEAASSDGCQGDEKISERGMRRESEIMQGHRGLRGGPRSL